MLAQDASTTVAERPQHAVTDAERLVFIDRVRVALTILVILQHLSLTYGAAGPWYYQEPVAEGSAAQIVLTIFILVNQAFFMGVFFLISAYFAARACGRKGAGQFTKDRLIRLGIPLVLYCLFLNPIAMLGHRFGDRSSDWLSTLPYWQFYLIGMTPGPLWFVETLLAFTIIYALWSRWSTPLDPPRASAGVPLRYRQIAGFVVILTLTTFIFRLWAPIGWFIPILDLPSLSHFPQYVALFIVGIVAYRRNWLASTPDAMGRVGFIVAMVASSVLLPVSLTDVTALVGGPHWQAFTYALWEALFCVGICLGVLTFFRRHWNSHGGLGGYLSARAYTAYIIHAPILVGLAFAMRGLDAHPLAKFALAAVIAIPLCFWSASLVRRLPLARQILR
jgi:fucose 4-O-acetylase-like acetyltransferase